MLKDKRAGTLVMALFMLAFVVIVGTSIVALAGTSANATVNTIKHQQAYFTAKSVLDSVISKIESGKINPSDIETKGLPNLSGSGSDDKLGTYEVLIEPHEAIESHPTYKVTVGATYHGTSAEIYSLISSYHESLSQSPAFDVIALSTGFGVVGSMLNNACIDSDIRLDNGGDMLALAASGYVHGNIEIIGGLDIDGTFIGGSGDKKTIDATEDIKIYGSAAVNSNINSEKNISIGGGTTVNGDVRCNGDITINGSARITGNIYANGKINVSGGAQITGNIYSNSDVSLTSSPVINGSVYAIGNIISVQSVITGGLYSNKSVLLTGNADKIYAGGDIELNQCTNIRDLRANGSIYVSDSDFSSDISARGNIVIGKNKAGNVSGCTIIGNLSAVGDISVYSSQITGNIQSAADILLDSNTRLSGIMHTLANVSVLNGSSFNGDVFAAGNFLMTGNSEGNVIIGKDAQIKYALLTGNLSAKSNGLFVNSGTNKNVTGTILLGGVLDPASNSANNVVLVNPDSIEDVAPVNDVPAVTAVSAADTNSVPLVLLNIDITAPSWHFPADLLNEAKQTTITVKLNSTSSPYYTISGNEHIIDRNCSLILDPKAFVWDKKIVLDATEKDLYIILKPSGSSNLVDIKSGVDILSKGDNNVFLFLDDGEGNYVNLNIASNGFVGYYDYINGVPDPDTRVPNLFIICNAQGTEANRPSISLDSYNAMYAFIYAPYATVDLTGSALFDKKLYGAVVASNLFCGNLMDYSHYVPDLSDYIVVDPDNPNTITKWIVQGTYLK